MFEYVRTFVWKHQSKLAAAYLSLLVIAHLALWAYPRFAPRSIDLGATIALRSLAYHFTFRDVRRARTDWEKGDIDRAEARLEQFVSRHEDVQPAHIHAHAVAEACEMLTDIYRQQERFGRAERTAEAWANTMPHNYRAWYVLSSVRKARGDLSGAADACRRAFKLTLCVPQIADDYIAILAELNDYEDILWVSREHERALRNAVPRAEIFIGLPRSSLQRQVMSLAKIPVGHGAYRVRFDTWLPRGEDKTLTLPPEVFLQQDDGGENLYVMLRVENAHTDFHVSLLRYRNQQGEWVDLKATDDWVTYMHRRHSGVEYYAEMRTNIPREEITACEIVCSSPGYALSGASERIVRRAKINAGHVDE